jgi:F420-dependent oxidoreductase-like protein
MPERELPSPAVVVLIGPSGAGKSSWAAAHFAGNEIVSSDALRAVVGDGGDDLDASDDAFALLDDIAVRRAARRRTVVIDTLGSDATRRTTWRDLAHRDGLACVAVVFDTPPALCRKRNRGRPRPVPAAVLTAQLKSFAVQRDVIAAEPWDAVITVVSVDDNESTTDAPLNAPTRATGGLRFGLHLGRFAFGKDTPWPDAIRRIACEAEAVGIDSLWVMDHLRQIPQVGRDWEDLPDPWTLLAHLAAHTDRVRLGTLVTAVTLRQPAVLAKAAATVDVLSGGRVVCGLGAAWYQREHTAAGIDFPSLSERYDRLEDTLRVLPLLWGPGAPSFEGKTLTVPEAIGYPRPVHGRIPLLVGGNGERRTLALAARYADACNLIGLGPDEVRHKVAVLHGHLQAAERSLDAIEVTHLSTTLTAPDRTALDAAIERHRGRSEPMPRFVARVNAGTVAEQIRRFTALAEAGVSTAIVSLPDIAEPGALERFAPIIAACSSAIGRVGPD